MAEALMRITLAPSVSMTEAQGTLRLAQLAVESVFGPEQVTFDAPVCVDHASRRFVFQVSHRAGRTFALVFVGYARREFGPELVHVEHVMPGRRLAAEKA